MTRLAGMLLLAALAGVFAPAVSVSAANLRSPHAGVTPFPVDSVRVGMTGVGLSVFEGTRIDSFAVTILGVLKGYRPGATLILARASSPFLERSGIIAGMSGSPVYIHGKLLGAIAYAWGFNKEPVGGITPIGDMLSLLPKEGTAAPPEDPENRLGALAPVHSDPLDNPGQARAIGTPLVLSGFTPEAIQYLDPWLKQQGFVASPGGGQIPGESCDELVPGAAIGVQLIRGDWSAAAIGTLTYRDGDRLLAFGHPFIALGWVRFPLTGAVIHTVFVNEQLSTKIGSPTTPCGTMIADRSTGIAAEIGPPPAMIPVAVSIEGNGGRERHYHFEVARSRFLAPQLVGMTVVNSISEALGDVGYATIRYNLAYMMNGGKTTIRRSNLFLTQSPVSGVGDDVTQTLQLLLSDHFKPTTLDSVHVDLVASPGLEASRISEVRLHPSTVSPGDSVEVEVLLRSGGSGMETRRIKVRVPPQTPPGELQVRACDGDETDKWEQDRTPDRYKPETFDELVRVLQEDRRNDRIYVQLFRASGGATVHGDEISQAPPSVLDVLQGEPKSGAVATTKGATIAETSIPLSAMARGCETAKLNVVPDLR